MRTFSGVLSLKRKDLGILKWASMLSMFLEKTKGDKIKNRLIVINLNIFSPKKTLITPKLTRLIPNFREMKK